MPSGRAHLDKGSALRMLPHPELVFGLICIQEVADLVVVEFQVGGF
jgi:hypothetical protein